MLLFLCFQCGNTAIATLSVAKVEERKLLPTVNKKTPTSKEGVFLYGFVLITARRTACHVPLLAHGVNGGERGIRTLVPTVNRPTESTTQPLYHLSTSPKIKVPVSLAVPLPTASLMDTLLCARMRNGCIT